jgi:hypothetical protein
MLNIIVDGACKEPERLSHQYLIPHVWQMNLMNLLNQGQGIAELLAADLGCHEGNWLIASPIYWQATHNDVMITSLRAKLDPEYLRVFQNFLALDASKLLVHPSGLWLFESERMPSLNSQDLEGMMHRSLYPFLEQMPVLWRTWFTETQMLFSPIFAAQANGLWPWGGGIFKLNQTLYALEPHLWPEKIAPIDLWHDGINYKHQDSVLLVTTSQLDELLPHLRSKARQITIWWNNGLETIIKPSLFRSVFKGWNRK